MSDDRESQRCPWVDLTKPDYVAYHDEEWGVPVFDDRRLFEFLTLESAQAGLSWYTILRRRENYRRAFADFDPEAVAKFDDQKIDALCSDVGLIRNRKKIAAAVSNAKRFLEVREEFGSFSAYIWRFVGGKPIVNAWKTVADYPATSPESIELSRDLKKRGFGFVGPTICYAHMQATGMFNDHSLSCFRRDEILESYEKIFPVK